MMKKKNIKKRTTKEKEQRTVKKDDNKRIKQKCNNLDDDEKVQWLKYKKDKESYMITLRMRTSLKKW